MKLLSLNIEGMRHLSRVVSFIDQEQPDILCLHEAPEAITDTLADLGYFYTFTPTTIVRQDGVTFPQGILLASKASHDAESYYYHKPHNEIVSYAKDNKRNTIAQAALFANVNGTHIATTHFTWTPEGETASDEQITDLQILLSYLQSKPAHVFCGDLNIPRNINILYNDLLQHYTDAVPKQYTSSLDRTLHRIGNDPTKQKIFDSFMVDHLLTQVPYTARNVRLKFDISDHAAIVGEIERTQDIQSTRPEKEFTLSQVL